jgi:large subunit ribosomal protein L21
VTVDRLSIEPGEQISIDQVLLVGRDGGDIVAGAPYVANARVIGVIEGESRGPKIRVFKKRRRKGFRKTTGHRSTLTRVTIKDIVL